MATIKFKRGTGQPTGLTAYEPAWDTTNNRLFINTGTTAMWIGAAVIQDTSLAGNCAWTIPTQNSVKSYVDTRVAAGSTSIQGNFLFIGGSTANAAPLNGDTADRGIIFQWNTGSAGRTGFFGFDQTTQRFTFISSGITLANGHVTGTAGNAELAGVYAPQGVLTLQGSSAANATIQLSGNTAGLSTLITHTAAITRFLTPDGINSPVLQIESTGTPGTYGTIASSASFTSKVFTLPDVTGVGLAAATYGATSGWILRAAGASSLPAWINPAASGFTAFYSENTGKIFINPVKNSDNYPVLFGGSTSGYQLVHADNTNDIRWNPGTITLTLGSGNGKLEGVVDGGAF